MIDSARPVRRDEPADAARRTVLICDTCVNVDPSAAAVAGEGVTVGPILLGAHRPAHILTPTSTVRRLVNMTALTAVEAQHRE